ncbi:MAG: HAD-like domain-containing protein [Monoraphidium minutum]|nr:MAG: HAD-like domain-containing protein [Monoraphidium minutum]
MDTIVQDPFFEHMPRFFDLSFQELLAAKHPTAWVEFECAQITEDQLFEKFFKDGRGFDGAALVDHMIAHYGYIDGMPSLLARLNAAGYAVHAMSNYPSWWRHIEAKLQLSAHLQWTFVSCEGPMKGVRKPAPDAYHAVVSTLDLPPSSLVFVDDRKVNTDAAAALGWGSVHFTGAAALEERLRAMGLEF